MRIESVCAAGGNPHWGARELADSVALGCIGEQHGDTIHVPLVIYTGIYPEDCCAEPAAAPFVQRALGEAAGRTPGHPDGGFSFDVDNLLVGLEIADGMMRSRGLARALVVASEGRERSSASCTGDVTAAAGALLVEPGSAGEGFIAWHSRAFPEHRDLYRGELRWTPGAGAEPGRHVMNIVQSSDYVGACVTSAESVLREFLSEMDIRSLEGLLILPSQSPAGFPQALTRTLAMKAGQVVDVPPESGVFYSAGPIAALATAVGDGRFARAEHVMWLTIQPGITVSAALYHAGGCPPKLRSCVMSAP